MTKKIESPDFLYVLKNSVHSLLRESIGWILILWTIMSMLIGCSSPDAPDSVLKNPNDTTSDLFVPPVTTIVSGPSDGATIGVSTVTFQWSGNAGVDSYSYNLDAASWSSWTKQTSATLDYLDEGIHSFTVRAIHHNNSTIETNPPLRNFSVDAVKGPSVMFLPRQKTVQAGETFMYDIKAEEVVSLYASRLSVTYDGSMVKIDSVSAGIFIKGGGGSAIVIDSVNNSIGKLIVNLVTIARFPKGISGSGSLVSLSCKALRSGTANFSFVQSGTIYRDTTNAAISIRTMVDGRVAVK